MSLYALTSDMLRLREEIAHVEEFCADDENADFSRVLRDTMEGMEGERAEKIENIGIYIKDLLAEAAEIDKEIKSLLERRKAKENRAESLKRYLSDALYFAGEDRFETARLRLSFRKSEAVVVDNEEEFIAWCDFAGCADDFLRTKTERTLDKTKIRAALKSGASVNGCHIIQTQSLQVK